MAPECESGAFGEVSVSSDLYSAGKILWSVVTTMNAFSRESPVFGQKSIPNLLPDFPEAWHLQHIFEKTIRQNPQDRCKNAKEALNLARRVQFLILSGYPPLELIDKNCPICGFGVLGAGSGGLHMVFGNPNPPGIVSCQCDYCGFCFAVNRELRAQNLQKKQQLS